MTEMRMEGLFKLFEFVCCCCSIEVQPRAFERLRTEHCRSVSEPLCIHLQRYYTQAES